MDTSKLISELKVPKLFREIITIVGGSGFLLILWILRLQYKHFTFELTLARPEADIIFLIIAYLIGKVTLYTTHILDWIDWSVNNLCDPEKYLYLKNLDLNKCREFLGYRSLAPMIDPLEIKKSITGGEVWKELANNELFEQTLERDRQSQIFTRFFIVYGVTISFYDDHLRLWSIIFTGFFIINWYINQRNLSSSWIDFQKHMVKERNKHPSEKQPIR